jgi:hypothetical protein
MFRVLRWNNNQDLYTQSLLFFLNLNKLLENLNNIFMCSRIGLGIELIIETQSQHLYYCEDLQQFLKK